MQLVTCLTTDKGLTVVPGVASLIPARSHTFLEIDHEIISKAILHPSTDSRRLLSVISESMCTNLSRSTGKPLCQATQEKSVVR